jgi:hypothetical protein
MVDQCAADGAEQQSGEAAPAAAADDGQRGATGGLDEAVFAVEAANGTGFEFQLRVCGGQRGRRGGEQSLCPVLGGAFGFGLRGGLVCDELQPGLRPVHMRDDQRDVAADGFFGGEGQGCLRGRGSVDADNDRPVRGGRWRLLRSRLDRAVGHRRAHDYDRAVGVGGDLR